MTNSRPMFSAVWGKPPYHSNTSSGFTLVELIVVVAMIMILAGAVTASVAGAQRRAKISQARATVQEITNAILAYENYVNESQMPSFPAWKDAAEADVAFLVGKGSQKSKFNEEIPVLYNASIKGGQIRDPWNRPYQIKIEQVSLSASDKVLQSAPSMCVQFPNFGRNAAWKE